MGYEQPPLLPQMEALFYPPGMLLLAVTRGFRQFS
jgi:hypothetical protein